MTHSQPDRAAEETRADADFPLHHVRPPSGWVNDPNGPIRWNGRYHLFFQHNPKAPVHGEICWGHVSSADLVDWTAEPVALVPGPGGADAAGCWSGCAVDDDGVATAVYTGSVAGPEDATICLAYARDDDLRVWEKRPEPVAGPPPHLALSAFRDPFVFDDVGRRYAAVGAGHAPPGRAAVLLYGCDDLADWRFLGSLLDTGDPVAAAVAPADVWECPHFFRIGGRWVLIVSRLGEHADRVAYLVGDLSTTSSGLCFKPSSGGLVDHGHDFYAAAVLAEDDRALAWGWTWEDRSDEAVARAGWAGALTMTRELTLSADGRLLSNPVAESAALHRGDAYRPARHTLAADGGLPLPDGPVDLLADVRSTGRPTVSLELDGVMTLRLDLARGTAEVARDVYDPTRREWATRAQFHPSGGRRQVRIIIDGSVVEIFVEEGPVFTERLYRTTSPRLVLRGDDGARCEVAVRPMSPPHEGG